MKNKIADLNNHLFAALERLNDEDISAEQLTQEIDRSRAICGVAMQIIEVGELAIEAEKSRSLHGVDVKRLALLGD